MFMQFWYTEMLNLKDVDEYKYLKQSNCYSITGVDDAEQFHIVKVLVYFSCIVKVIVMLYNLRSGLSFKSKLGKM